jgi:hypothetical protein
LVFVAVSLLDVHRVLATEPVDLFISTKALAAIAMNLELNLDGQRLDQESG